MTGDIRELALRFDRALEQKDYEAVLSAFHEDCTITLLGIELIGREGAKKWIDWLFSHVEELHFEPVVIMTRENIFFEEYSVRARTAGGRTVESRQAEVLVFEEGRIRSLRLYFDLLDVAEALAGDFFGRMAISHIRKKSTEGLR
jgi:ketosteroid isomerase-like protein